MVKVSACCTVYNHESFVDQALTSILSQKLDSSFEVIVHDDASTDQSQQIIGDYAARFPDLVVPMIQQKNQWENGNAASRIAIEAARGEYVAFCEADDYWSNPSKLLVQSQLLDENPDAAGCFHSADDLLEDTGELRKAFWKPEAELSSYGLDYLLSQGTFASMGSLMLRKSALEGLPCWGKRVSHMDFGVLAFAMQGGDLLYIDSPMSVYRRHSKGFHSTSYGAVSASRALSSTITVAHSLGLQNRPSYLQGLQWRLEQLEASVVGAEQNRSAMEEDISQLRENYDGLKKSRFFRTGVYFDRMSRKLRLRG